MKSHLQIHALKIPHNISHHQLEGLYYQVTSQRQAKVKKMLKKADIIRSLTAELLLSKIALPMAGLKIDFLLFTYNEYGKPALADYPDIHFNLSHSGNLVVCAVDSSPVGIDIEEIQPIDLTIAQSFCSQEELSLLAAKEDKLRCFYDLWTIKESYVKAIGKGLSLPLGSFSVHKNANKEITIFLSEKRWFFRQYSIDDGYVLSLCASHHRFPQNVVWAELEQLFQG